MSDAADKSEEVKTKEPSNKAITQQALPACKPVLDKTWVVFIFFCVTVVCIPIGVVCLIYGLKPVEVSYQYDQACLSNFADNAARQTWLWQNAGNASSLSCGIQLNITKDMPGPVYVFYEISGMYQNHRRYVRSRSDTQMADTTSSPSTGACSPQQYYNDNSSLAINPCGLIAWSYFNDTYDLTLFRNASASTLVVQSTGIAFPADKKYRFGNQIPTNFNPYLNASRGGGQIQGTPQQDERFINWVRISALPKFRKLWGKIEGSLMAGDVITVKVLNQYNTYSFDGAKSLVLSNTTWLGGRNIFLGVAYLVTGGLSLILGLIYLLLTAIRPRKFADVSLLK